MSRLLLPTLLLLLLSPASFAQGDAPAADPVLRAQLEKLDYKYEVDEDGDYRLVFDLDGEDGRSQMVYVRSPVEQYGQFRIREVWSPAWRSETDEFPAAIANRLLTASQDTKLGAWVKQGNTAMFVVKIPADADEQALSDAIDAAIRSADEMEVALTDGKDEF